MVLGYMILNAVLVTLYLAMRSTQRKRYQPLLVSATGLGFLAVLAQRSPVALVVAAPTVALLCYLGIKNFRICPECNKTQPNTKRLTPPRTCTYCGARL